MKNTKFLNLRYIYIVIFATLALSSLFYSCKSTRRVPDGSYLLKENKVIVTKKRTIVADNIYPYIYQKPNRKMLFGWRFYLGLYNLASTDTTKCFSNTLRNWGEPPVIYNPKLAKSSLDNIKQYLRTEGFYYSTVKDSVVYGNKKAKVYYIVNPNSPYRIQSVSYDIKDTAIQKIVLADTLSSNLKKRRHLSTEILDSECERITDLLKDKGYFAFDKGFVTFEADTLKGDYKVDLKVVIANVPIIDSTEKRISINHKKYKINDVFIYTNYDPIEFYSDSTYLKKFDTIYTSNVYLLYNKTLNLRKGIIPRSNLIIPGMIYNKTDVNQTYTNFSNLRIYKSVTIQFKETNKVDEDGNAFIDCVIQLNPLKSQSMKTDLEMSLSSSDLIGFSPGIHYGHRNLLHGAELFSLDFRGVFQYSLPKSPNPQNSFEFNISSSVVLPLFLAPIKISYFKRQIPHTKFASSYTYQQRPDYTRSVASGSIGYLWNNSSRLSFILNPIDFNMVRMLSLNPDFYNKLKNPYLKNTYQDHFNLGMTGSMIYTNQNQIIDFSSRRNRRFDTYYFRINTDIAGNVLSLFNSLMKYDQDDDYHMIINTRYAQYAKIDFNFTYNKPVLSRNNIVYRLVLGIGKPYGNSISLPFEKMFYGGGANSLRAWPIRGVGPGSAQPDTSFSIPNQVADFRFEFNAEYRFQLFWRFEGAIFLDAGNIWSISADDPRHGAQITSNFYKEIAANTGLGLRMNLVYFVFRIDTGLKIHDPALPESNRFIAPGQWLKGSNYSVNFSINYPF